MIARTGSITLSFHCSYTARHDSRDPGWGFSSGLHVRIKCIQSTSGDSKVATRPRITRWSLLQLSVLPAWPVPSAATSFWIESPLGADSNSNLSFSLITTTTSSIRNIVTRSSSSTTMRMTLDGCIVVVVAMCGILILYRTYLRHRCRLRENTERAQVQEDMRDRQAERAMRVMSVIQGTESQTRQQVAVVNRMMLAERRRPDPSDGQTTRDDSSRSSWAMV